MRDLKQRSGYVSFMGTSNVNDVSRNLSPMMKSHPASDLQSEQPEAIGTFNLIDKPPAKKIEWFDVNIMEAEDESFTLGFSAD